MFVTHVESFSATNEWCKAKGARISEAQMKSLFCLLDIDESGELEQEEIIDVLQDRQLLGQSRDTKAKQEALDHFKRVSNKWRSWVRDFVGF